MIPFFQWIQRIWKRTDDFIIFLIFINVKTKGFNQTTGWICPIIYEMKSFSIFIVSNFSFTLFTKLIVFFLSFFRIPHNIWCTRCTCEPKTVKQKGIEWPSVKCLILCVPGSFFFLFIFHYSTCIPVIVHSVNNFYSFFQSQHTWVVS